MTRRPDEPEPRLPAAPAAREALDRPDDPPVVARLVVEIRSDGSRTVARGAVDDLENGVRVALEARGSTPASLAATLLRSFLDVPALARFGRVARSASRVLLPGRRRPNR